MTNKNSILVNRYIFFKIIDSYSLTQTINYVIFNTYITKTDFSEDYAIFGIIWSMVNNWGINTSKFLCQGFSISSAGAIQDKAMLFPTLGSHALATVEVSKAQTLFHK